MVILKTSELDLESLVVKSIGEIKQLASLKKLNTHILSLYNSSQSICGDTVI